MESNGGVGQDFRMAEGDVDPPSLNIAEFYAGRYRGVPLWLEESWRPRRRHSLCRH